MVHIVQFSKYFFWENCVPGMFSGTKIGTKMVYFYKVHHFSLILNIKTVFHFSVYFCFLISICRPFNVILEGVEIL